MTTFERLDGPATSLVSARPGPDLAALGWFDEEYVARGTACRYTGDLPSDGRFLVRPGDSAEFATRVAVRRPADPAVFSGTLVVEWLNVSSGQDAAPGWTFLADEVVRRGHAWLASPRSSSAWREVRLRSAWRGSGACVRRTRGGMTGSSIPATPTATTC